MRSLGRVRTVHDSAAGDHGGQEVLRVPEGVGQGADNEEPGKLHVKVSIRRRDEDQAEDALSPGGVLPDLLRRRGLQGRHGCEVRADLLRVLRQGGETAVQDDEGSQGALEGEPRAVHVRRLPRGEAGFRERAGPLHAVRADQALQEGGRGRRDGGCRVQGSPDVSVLQEALLLGPGALQPHANAAHAVLLVQEGEAERLRVLQEPQGIDGPLCQ
mmetsp:Transcript_13269/g.37245  ORF Transcript_13269/g.37245 Transcript_13269/m.37245 type:complete len:215 (-) Transcript_13269:4221-4865(-)